MRIAVIGPAYPYKGGAAQHTAALAHRLVAAGHQVRIESWSRQFPARLYPGELTIDEPEVPVFDNTRRELSWRRPDGWLRVGRRLRRTADAVVLSVTTPVQVPAYLGILRGLGHGPRTVAVCHNVLPHERRFFDAGLMRALLRRVDGVVTHAPGQARLARALTRTRVAAADLPPHLPGRSAATPAVREQPHRVLLFFGFVRPYKGLDVLLRALAQGPRDVSLLVAGEFWGGVEDTERLVAELGLAGRVTLRPSYVPAAQLPSLFAGIDALVLPYRTATASQNVWIAHEHGVPVVATRVGTLAHQVRDGVDGLLCAPDDADDLTRALERFYAAGQPGRLTANVRPADPEPYWKSYVDTLVEMASPPAPPPAPR